MKKIFLILPILLSACGTIFNGTTQTMTFDSNVKDVKIYVNNQLICSQTPCTIDVDRESSTMIVTAKKEGYKDGLVNVKSKINGTTWFNILFSYGFTTDFAMGGMWKYTQDGVYINMEPENMQQAEAKQFRKDSKIRAFSLYNFKDLQLEAATHKKGEYTKALAELTNLNPDDLHSLIAASQTEVALAHRLTAVN